MGDVIRLCRLVGGRCLPYCSHLDKSNDRCRRAPRPPKRWGNGAEIIEVPFEEWQQGERGGGESEGTYEPTIGRPPKHRAPPYVPNMDGASISKLEEALEIDWERLEN